MWRSGFDSLVILVAWCLWKERNQRTFHAAQRTPVQLADVVGDEAERWSTAGFSQLAALWSIHDRQRTSQNSSTM
jgi:hypothetical protein